MSGFASGLPSALPMKAFRKLPSHPTLPFPRVEGLLFDGLPIFKRSGVEWLGELCPVEISSSGLGSKLSPSACRAGKLVLAVLKLFDEPLPALLGGI